LDVTLLKIFMKDFLKFVSIALLAGFLNFSIASDKENWVFVDKQSDNNYFVDINSIKKNGNSVTFWKKMNLSKRDSSGSLSYKFLITVNCRTRENTVREVISYDDEDARGLVIMNVEIKTNWEKVDKNKLALSLYNFICKK
jgi:hypothetical protein